MRTRRLASILLALALLLPLAPSSVPPASAAATPIMGRSVLIADQLSAWFASTGRRARLDGLSVARLAQLFVEEGAMEGVRCELAFAQTIFETGFLQFSERFPPECHNYAGIGGTQKRHCFPNARTGIRAQIQHLRAYADPTVGVTGTANPLVDPRFDLVSPKGQAPTVEDLSGRWAPGEDYGQKIVRIYQAIRAHAGPTLRDRALGAPIVGAASPPGSGGVWLADSAGGVFTLGGVPFLGSIPGLRQAGQQIGEATIVGMAATPDGKGYWLVDDEGGVFTFGSARFFGSIPGLRAAGQQIGHVGITAVAAAPDGAGYWLVDSIGGVFPFGSARFFGSIPGLRAKGQDIGTARVVAIVALPGGGGYWLVDSAGGTFPFGSARFRGSAAEAGLQMVGAIASADGAGYRIVSNDGALITYV